MSESTSPNCRIVSLLVAAAMLCIGTAQAGEVTATQRGRNLSRNPRSGHHNIGFRCAL